MLLKALKWIRGYLLIRMKGQSPERFINLCSNWGLYIWNIRNVKGEYEFYITLRDYLKIKPIAKKTRTIPLIKKRYGLPFLMHKYKKRKGYVLGILMFSAIVYILSLYIWDISVLGGHSYTEESMVKFLRSNQIYAGLQKKEIHCQDIEELIRATYNDIGWVSAEVKGTRLIIKITETNMPTPAVTMTQPVHIVASKDCIITDIITRTGTALVEEGTVVKKGDILVSGVVDIIGDNDVLLEKKPVIADADVIGKTYYEYEDKFSMDYIDKQYTGNKKTGHVISVMLKKFNIYNPSIPYTKYDIIKEELMLHINDSFYLPISHTSISYVEYNEALKKYTEKEAITIAKKKLQRYFDNLIAKDVIIIENNVKITIDKNECISKGKIIVQESVKDYKTIEDNEWRIIETDESIGNNN